MEIALGISFMSGTRRPITGQGERRGSQRLDPGLLGEIVPVTAWQIVDACSTASCEKRGRSASGNPPAALGTRRLTHMLW
jgi:hypothetical protein